MTIQFHPDHTFKPNRDAEMESLVTRLKAYGLPTTWKTLISESSITLTSPKRKRIIKFDSYRTVTIDVISGPLQVKSSVFTCKTVDEVWSMVEKALNAYVKREPQPEVVHA